MNHAEVQKNLTDLLCYVLTPLVHQGFQSIYETALRYKTKHNIDADVLRIFQDLIRNVIPSWSPEVVANETKRIRLMCPYGDQLQLILNAVREAGVTSMTGRTARRLEYYEAYPLEGLVQKTYLFAAREIYKNPYLFSDQAERREIKDNQREALRIIGESVRQAVLHSLPVAAIAAAYLEHEGSEAEIDIIKVDGTNEARRVLTTYNIREDDLLSCAETRRPALVEGSLLTLPASQPRPQPRPQPTPQHGGDGDDDEERGGRGPSDDAQAPPASPMGIGRRAERTRGGDARSLTITLDKVSNFLRELPPDLLDETLVQSTIDEMR